MTLQGAWRLLRPGNALIAAAGVAAGHYLAGGIPGAPPEWFRVALGAVAAFAFAGAGNARNDLLDVDIDRQAHPERPLVTGAVSPRAARALVATLYAGAFAAGGLLGWAPLLLVAGAFGLMEAYERGLKARGLPGNAAVSALTAAPFLLGGLVATSTVTPLVWSVALLAFLANLGREVLKDVEDATADAIRRRTLANRWGSERAGFAATLAFALVILLSPAPFLLRSEAGESVLGWAYLPAVVTADAAFLWAAWPGAGAGRRQRVAKAGMVLALAALLAGRAHLEAWLT